MEPLTAALLVGAGLAGGVASGLFGIGGGVIMVPAAVLLLGAPFHEAKAASLLAITLVSALGVWEHRKERHVDLRLGAALAAGGVAGSLLAVALAERVAAAQLEGAFGAVLVALGARLWFEVRPLGGRPRRARGALLPLGLGAGLLAGLFGVGGGVLMVPGMVLLGVGVHTAVGTSLVAVLANSAAGTLGHAQLGYAAAMAALGLPLALGAAAGIVAGARIASRTRASGLRRAFGVFLAALGLAMALKSLGWWGA